MTSHPINPATFKLQSGAVALQVIVVVVSILTLTAISGERYCAICRPLTFKQTRTRVVGCLVVIWVAAHLAAVPRLIIMELQHDDLVPPNVTVLLTSCVPSPALKAVALHYEVFLCVVFYALPIAVMGYTYTAVAWCLWSSAKTSILTGKGWGWRWAWRGL